VLGSRYEGTTMPDVDNKTCPLCQSHKAETYFQDRKRAYYRCPICLLVYVPREYHLGRDEEKQRYDSHQNNPDDPAYRRFLNQLMSPLVTRLRPGQRGIDFGSGPGPALATMFGENGYEMLNYDIFYANDEDVLQQQYDFLTCTETMEHFASPGAEWERFLHLVKIGGWLGIMTQMLEDGIDFGSWYYKNDETHICFYARETFQFLAERYGLSATFVSASVILLKREA